MLKTPHFCQVHDNAVRVAIDEGSPKLCEMGAPKLANQLKHLPLPVEGFNQFSFRLDRPVSRRLQDLDGPRLFVFILRSPDVAEGTRAQSLEQYIGLPHATCKPRAFLALTSAGRKIAI